jgi:glutamyl-tRNA reductase
MSEQSQIVLTGLNHKSAPVGLRERLSFDGETTPQALAGLLESACLDEVALLSTCNRTEIYAVSADPEGAQQGLCQWLATRAGLGADELDPHLYHGEGSTAVTHLLRVASGLDSLVLGEPQILGQVRDAFEAARVAGTTDQRLAKLFRSAVETGKTVRSSTALGAMPVSVASVAVQLVERVFGRLGGRSVLIVGAGEICTAAAIHIAERHPERLAVINRTEARAIDLAERCCGEAAPLTRLRDELCLADIVVTSTGSPEPLITREMLDDVMRRRRGEQMLIVDVAVPRDVEASAGDINNLYLYNVDDLQQIAAENMKQRVAEVPAAERLVAAAAARYMTWEESLAVVPIIVALRSRLESIRQAGVEQYVGKLPQLDDQGRRCIEQMTQTIVNRILHEPQTRLRQCGGGPSSGASMAESLRYLFDLDTSHRSPGSDA